MLNHVLINREKLDWALLCFTPPPPSFTPTHPGGSDPPRGTGCGWRCFLWMCGVLHFCCEATLAKSAAWLGHNRLSIHFIDCWYESLMDVSLSAVGLQRGKRKNICGDGDRRATWQQRSSCHTADQCGNWTCVCACVCARARARA